MSDEFDETVKIDESEGLRELVEKDLDSNYRSANMVSENAFVATWYLLTVLEDCVRQQFVQSDDAASSLIEQLVDRLKYATRFALDRIRSECKDRPQTPVPDRVIPEMYIGTLTLLGAGMRYMAANQVCSAAHAGTLRFAKTALGIEVVSDPKMHDRRYAALEILGAAPADFVDHFARLYVWTRHQELCPRVAFEIARSTRVHGKRVIYRYDQGLAIGLAQELQQAPSIIPEKWTFPWGGPRETTLLLNALCVRCAYLRMLRASQCAEATRKR